MDFRLYFAAVHAQNWVQIPGGLKHISGSVNYVWGVNSADEISVYIMCPNPCTGQWVRIDGALTQVDAGYYEVWGVTSNDDIFRRKVDGSSSWILVPGKLKHVSAWLGHAKLIINFSSPPAYFFGTRTKLHYCIISYHQVTISRVSEGGHIQLINLTVLRAYTVTP